VTAAAKPLPNKAKLPTGVPLEGFVTTSKKLPNRVLLYAPEKWGKTSFASEAPDPIFICTEDGLDKLLDEGRVTKPIMHNPEPFSSWHDVTLAVNSVVVMEHTHRTLVIDTLNGVEQLLFKHIIKTKCDNDPEKFDAYGRGPKIAAQYWQDLLDPLDSCRRRGMSILLLAHARISKFSNPEGDDYDRYSPDMDKYSWAVLHKWLDMILFGNFEVFTTKTVKSAAKAKAEGGTSRILYCERTAAFDAGNRHGLPAEIELGNSPAEAFKAFLTSLKKGQAQ
jgi:hypothetical protein